MATPTIIVTLFLYLFQFICISTVKYRFRPFDQSPTYRLAFERKIARDFSIKNVQYYENANDATLKRVAARNEARSRYYASKCSKQKEKIEGLERLVRTGTRERILFPLDGINKTFRTKMRNECPQGFI